MRLDNLSPSDSEAGVVPGVLGLEYVSDSLSEVEWGVFLIIYALDLQQSELLGLGRFSSLETNEGSLLIKST